MTFTDQREELLESIERDQEEALFAVQELTQVARDTFSVRDHIRDNPMMWLAGGFLLGMWLGGRPRPAPPQIVIATEGDLRP